MRLRNGNRIVQGIMAAALAVTAIPLLRPLWPSEPLVPRPEVGMPDVIEPGLVVVDARDDLTPRQLSELNRRHQIQLRYNSQYARKGRLLIAEVTPGQEEAVAAKLSEDPLVEVASPMRRYSLPPLEKQRVFPATTPKAKAPSPERGSWIPNDPLYDKQWHLQLIGAERAWTRATGKGIIVAVIDTGVAFESDEKCYQARDFGSTRFAPGYDFVDQDAHPNDDHGHGTHVAGTIAESTNNGEGAAGLAFDVTIMPLKVLDGFGSGRSSDIADAIRYAADHGAHVLNLSLGGPYPDPVIRKACQYAAEKGVLIVCAAGNSGGGPVGYPAAFPECVAVSSVGPGGKLASYSSVGKEIALAGPGGDTSQGESGGVLQNTVLDGDPGTDGYYAFQGTSMASPHVAAVAALAMSVGVRDPDEVRQLLQRGAMAREPKEQYGAGILRADKTADLAHQTRRNSFFRVVLALVVAGAGFGSGAARGRFSLLTRFPFVPLGFVAGLLGPDFVFRWFHFGSPFTILFHSALIPLYLLWEAESGSVYRFVSAMAFGVALHLGWDAFQGHVPFGGILPVHGLPWMWVNTAVGLGVALVAWRRSFATS